MAELDALLTPGTIIVSDASYATLWSANYLHSRADGQRFLAPRGLAGLGWGLPLALGAKIASPQMPVVCITGDGGFGHVWSELETAVRSKIPLTVIVLNNSILGYQKHSESVQFSAYTSAIQFNSVDHAEIARACGADAVRVDNPDVLGPVLQRSLHDDRVTVLDVITDPAAYPPITAWDNFADRLRQS